MRQLKILNIRDVGHLGKLLGTCPQELEKICGEIERYYHQGPRVIKGKTRHIATPQGRLREILDRLQRLLQRVSLPESIHGGRKGHSYITNATRHEHKPTVFGMDIKNYFPSIPHHRVYDLFWKRLGCSPDVARYLTRLTTLNGCLPQGSPTSTILSALVSEPLAIRLQKLAIQHKAENTQYVDDIHFSGPCHIAKLVPLVGKIVKQEGFEINPSKSKIANANKEQTVTGLRVNQGIDVPRNKMKEARQFLEEIKLRQESGRELSRRELASIKGKIRHIENFNHGAGRFLQRDLKRILLLKPTVESVIEIRG